MKEKHGWKMVLKAQEQEKKDQKGKRLKDELELKIWARISKSGCKKINKTTPCHDTEGVTGYLLAHIKKRSVYLLLSGRSDNW